MLQKEDNDWVKKCVEYEEEGSRPRGRPKRTWLVVVLKDCQAHKLSREDAVDRGRWRKLIIRMLKPNFILNRLSWCDYRYFTGNRNDYYC